MKNKLVFVWIFLVLVSCFYVRAACSVVGGNCSDCKDLFVGDYSVDSWYFGANTTMYNNICTDGEMSYTLNSDYCDSVMISGIGECAEVYTDPGYNELDCPSYERNNNVSVNSSVCYINNILNNNGTNLTDYFNFNNVFFSGFVSNDTGCFYENPSCGSEYDCVNNSCVLKSGCTYHNPDCGNYTELHDINNVLYCADNECVLKTGCYYNNPECNSSSVCSSFGPDSGINGEFANYVCLLKSGCSYNNPDCVSDYDCVDNSCVLKSGCAYNNPSCTGSYSCIDNECVVGVVRPVTSWSSVFWFVIVLFIVGCLFIFAFVIRLLRGG